MKKKSHLTFSGFCRKWSLFCGVSLSHYSITDVNQLQQKDSLAFPLNKENNILYNSIVCNIILENNNIYNY